MVSQATLEFLAILVVLDTQVLAGLVYRVILDSLVLVVSKACPSLSRAKLPQLQICQWWATKLMTHTLLRKMVTGGFGTARLGMTGDRLLVHKAQAATLDSQVTLALPHLVTQVSLATQA